MEPTPVPTVRLNNGLVVLAKQTKYGLSAVGYANRTQAYRRCADLQQHGVRCHVRALHPFCIVIEGGAA